jgi:hypothetical protein
MSTTLLTTLEGGESELTELEGDLYITKNGEVYYESAAGEYSELGNVEEVFNKDISELAGSSDFEELLDGEAPELEDKEVEIFIHKNGKAYYKSPLGGYSELGNTNDVLGCDLKQLHGLEGFEEITDHDELGKGFKFKAPKLKIKAPKFKFKAPKIKFKAPKINTKGLSKTFKSVGKAVSSGAKAFSKGVSSFAKGAAKALSPLAEALMNQDQPGDTEENPDEEGQEDEEQNTEEVNETDQGYDEGEDMITEESVEEMSGFHKDHEGKIYYFSELHGEYREIGKELNGILDMVTGAASKGGSGGLLDLATTGLDAFIPGAGSVAKIGINAVQKQQAKKKAKKAANQATREKLLKHYVNRKESPTRFIKPKTPAKTVTRSQVPKQIKVKQSIPQVSYSSTSPINYSNPQPMVRNETDYQPSQVQQDKKNEIAKGVGVVIIVLAVLYSMNSKKGRK